MSPSANLWKYTQVHDWVVKVDFNFRSLFHVNESDVFEI